MAGERVADRRLAGDDGRRAAAMRRRVASTLPDWFVTSSRFDLSLDSLDVLAMSCTVGGSFVSTAAVQLRRVGDEPRHLRERLGARRPQLIDERGGRDDLALERLFGLPRDADVDQVDGDADRQHREQGARQKDAAAERGEEAHHRSVKSSSATPPSGTVTGFGSDETPSFQAMTL